MVYPCCESNLNLTGSCFFAHFVQVHGVLLELAPSEAASSEAAPLQTVPSLVAPPDHLSEIQRGTLSCDAASSHMSIYSQISFTVEGTISSKLKYKREATSAAGKITVF
jgi:hypothetical protein